MVPGRDNRQQGKNLWDYKLNEICGTAGFFFEKGASVAKPNRRVRIAAISVASNTSLIILKVIAGVLSGSVSIIS